MRYLILVLLLTSCMTAQNEQVETEPVKNYSLYETILIGEGYEWDIDSMLLYNDSTAQVITNVLYNELNGSIDTVVRTQYECNVFNDQLFCPYFDVLEREKTFDLIYISETEFKLADKNEIYRFKLVE